MRATGPITGGGSHRVSLLVVVYAVRWLLVGRRRLVLLVLLVLLIRLLLRLVRLVVSAPIYQFRQHRYILVGHW